MRAIPGRVDVRAARRRGCAGNGAATACIAVVLGTGTASGFTRAQADYGAWIFRRECARCHGSDGGGKDDAWKGLRAPALIGPDALPEAPRPFQQIRVAAFDDAMDVWQFASAAMPADQPASLEPEEYWDVLAFILGRNGEAPDEQPLDAASAATVPLLHRERTQERGGP